MRYSIGGLSVLVSWDPGLPEPLLDPVYEAFRTDTETSRRDGIELHVAGRGRADLGACEELFSTLPDGLWKVWGKKDRSGYLLTLHDVQEDERVYRFAETDRTFTRFRIFRSDGGDAARNPLEYPLDELAIAGHLNINCAGILLHSALVSIGGEGLLFSGTSGSGKSTISSLWLQEPDAEVLTDERVIIRETDAGLMAWGTPWHGTAGIHKNRGAPVSRIFFLRHGPENHISRLTAVDAASRLMVRCFPTFWHREGMAFSLGLCGLIAQTVEAFELSFLPDGDVVEFIKDRI